MYPGVHLAQNPWLVQGGDCPALLCPGVAQPRALCAVLGSTMLEGKATGSCPKEGHEEGEGLEGK